MIESGDERVTDLVLPTGFQGIYATTNLSHVFRVCSESYYIFSMIEKPLCVCIELTATTLWANLVENKQHVCSLIFPRNRLRHFIQINCLLKRQFNELQEPYFLRKIRKNISNVVC